MGMIYVGSGVNNQDIEKNYRKIIRGSSWKKQRVVAVIPTAEKMDTVVALSHWSLIFPPNQPNVKFAAIGCEVGEAYETTITDIVTHPEMGEWEYILTIEHDNIPEADGLLKLVKRMEEHPEFAAISGLYWMKGPGGVPQCWGDPTDPVLNFRPIAPKEGEIIEVNGIGMGFALWRMSMFKDHRLREGRDGKPRPLFKTEVDKDGHSTQDLYFWMQAKYCGYRCAVDCDVKVGHYDSDTQICW
jgi:hypothetical protein